MKEYEIIFTDKKERWYSLRYKSMPWAFSGFKIWITLTFDNTAQKMKFSIYGFFSKSDKIRWKLPI